jgi:uncharacterized membrane protein
MQYTGLASCSIGANRCVHGTDDLSYRMHRASRPRRVPKSGAARPAGSAALSEPRSQVLASARRTGTAWAAGSARCARFAGPSRLGERPRPYSRPRLLAMLVACCLALAAAFFAAPTFAQAKSYTMPQVDINATVMPNGDLHVVEKRTFDFDGSYSAVWWNFENSDVEKKDRHGYTVNSVKIKLGDGKTQTVESVPFQTEWRNAGGPGTTAWSYDRKKTSLYLFFSVADQNMTATIDYTVKQAAIAYEDVGEIYWKYVGSGWAADSQNVTCTIHTPMPLNAKADAGENLRAWGHGPLDGSVSIAADGTVLYRVDRIASGHYGEARVVFPVEWLTKLPASAKRAHGDELGLETILQEEQNWADASNMQRVAGFLFIAVFIVISLLLLVWTVITFLRHGRELKPTFTEKYWRDVPDKDLHPAVAGRCWRFRKESTDDLTATLMHLSAMGAVAINKGTRDMKGLLGRTKQVEDLYLTRIPEVANALPDELDRDALHLVFDAADGGDTIWLSDFQAYTKEHARTFGKRVEAWQGKVTARALRAEIFEAKGPHRRTVMNLVAGIYALAGVAICAVTVNFVPLAAVLPTCLVMIVFARFMDRRTQKGADLQARSKALRNWLCDFTRLDEQPPTGVKVWGEFMVYAYLFGVADEVIGQLKIEMPQLFNDDAMVVGGVGYMPFYWYPGVVGASVTAAADVFDTAVSNSLDVVHAAASGASGGFSSGAGMGGGFSAGGGAGFGGGGGAR